MLLIKMGQQVKTGTILSKLGCIVNPETVHPLYPDADEIKPESEIPHFPAFTPFVSWLF